jgi:hypothetical protein
MRAWCSGNTIAFQALVTSSNLVARLLKNDLFKQWVIFYFYHHYFSKVRNPSHKRYNPLLKVGFS